MFFIQREPRVFPLEVVKYCLTFYLSSMHKTTSRKEGPMKYSLFLVIGRRILSLLLLCLVLAFLIHYLYLGERDSDVITYYDIEKSVLIDAGHGGRDPGANFRDILEKDITLSIAKELRRELEEKNITGILTRDGDYLLAHGPIWKDLKARAYIGEEEEVDLLVSIHVNNFKSSECFGGQVFFHPDDEKSKKLAQAIQEELYTIQVHNTRKIMPAENLYLLNLLDVPSVLVEVGFIKNAEDREFMASSQGQRELARVIGNGIRRYFQDEIGDLALEERWKEEHPLNISNQEALLYFLHIERRTLKPVLVSLPFKEREEIEVEEYANLLLSLLLQRPPQELGLLNLLEEDHVIGLSLQGEDIVVNLSQKIKEDFLGGSLLEGLIVASIKETLKGIPQISQVHIQIEGRKMETIGGHIILSPHPY